MKKTSFLETPFFFQFKALVIAEIQITKRHDGPVVYFISTTDFGIRSRTFSVLVGVSQGCLRFAR